MKRVLVAGATGQLGRYVAGELKRRGYFVRALVRDASNLAEVRDAFDETVQGDVTRRETLRGACDGVDVVFSSIGASLSLGLSKGRLSYTEIDYAGNKNLLDEARSAGVRKFVYVSVFGAERLRGVEYVDAHERFVEELKHSGLDYAIVRPTGFFSALAEVLKMARRGPVMSVGAGSSRTNPIHEEDLARVCVDAVESDARELAAGGPETYTRRELAELAFDALGKRPKVIEIPPWLLRSAIGPMRLFDRRLHALMSFFVAVSQVDAVAPASGTRSLKEYFRHLA